MRLTTFAGARLPVLCTAVLSLAVLPAAAVAQARPSADLFLLQNDALVGSSPLYGLGFATGGTIGVRVSGAAGFSSTVDEYGNEGTGFSAYSADADLVLSLGALAGATGARGRSSSGVSPYVFAGLGVIGRRIGSSYDMDFYGDEWERGPSASYGAGVSLPLGDVLGLDGSARYRVPFADSSQWAGDFPRGWEYRIGLKLHLGGGSRGSAYPRRRSTSRGSTRSRGSTVEQMGVLLPSIPASGRSGSAARVVNTADDYLGVPYVWGGDTPRGFDCSGFTKYVFARHGIELPRVSRQQAQVGSRVSPSLSSLRTGDLLFFAADYRRVDHVAIYAGDGQIIHATASGGEVRYDDLRSQRGQWFMDHMIGARRVTGSETVDWVRALGLVGQIVKEFDRGDRAPRPR